MGKQSSTLLQVGKADPPEAAAIDPRNSIVTGESLIHIGVICRQKLEHASIPTKRLSHKHFRFALECLEQAFVVTRITQWINDDFAYPPEVEPLRCEALDKGINRSGILQHACHLLVEDLRVS